MLCTSLAGLGEASSVVSVVVGAILNEFTAHV